jgi:hypothetical protein
VGKLPEKTAIMEDPSILTSQQIHAAPHFFGSLSNLSSKTMSPPNSPRESKLQKPRLLKNRPEVDKTLSSAKKEMDPIDKYMELWKSKRSLKNFGVDKVTWLD